LLRPAQHCALATNLHEPRTACTATQCRRPSSRHPELATQCQPTHRRRADRQSIRPSTWNQPILCPSCAPASDVVLLHATPSLRAAIPLPYHCQYRSFALCASNSACLRARHECLCASLPPDGLWCWTSKGGIRALLDCPSHCSKRPLEKLPIVLKRID
jgi:hypothetical protein